LFVVCLPGFCHFWGGEWGELFGKALQTVVFGWKLKVPD